MTAIQKRFAYLASTTWPCATSCRHRAWDQEVARMNFMMNDCICRSRNHHFAFLPFHLGWLDLWHQSAAMHASRRRRCTCTNTRSQFSSLFSFLFSLSCGSLLPSSLSNFLKLNSTILRGVAETVPSGQRDWHTPMAEIDFDSKPSQAKSHSRGDRWRREGNCWFSDIPWSPEPRTNSGCFSHRVDLPCP